MRIVKITLEGYSNTGRTAMAEVIKRKLSSLNVSVNNLDQREGLDYLWNRTDPEEIVNRLTENEVSVEISIKDLERTGILPEPKPVPVYLVWNNEKTEGFFTTDKQVAYEARKSASTNCFYRDGTRSDLAVAFCDIHGDKDCTMEEINITPGNQAATKRISPKQLSFSPHPFHPDYYDLLKTQILASLEVQSVDLFNAFKLFLEKELSGVPASEAMVDIRYWLDQNAIAVGIGGDKLYKFFYADNIVKNMDIQIDSQPSE